jgi:ubiquinone/menaquinone biosynthesis C-methylase UbiE
MDKDYYLYNEMSFRKCAPVYNLIISPLTRMRHRVAGLSGAGRGDKVLDVFTGTGAQAFAFGKRGCDVTGIDISRDMMGIA